MKKFNVWKLLLKIIPIILVAFVVWFFFIKPKSLTTIVSKVQLENKVVTRTVSASGTIKSNNQSDMSFPGMGKISQVYVKKGDTVTRGQTLAYLDTSSLSQTIEAYKSAKDILERQRELFIYQKAQNVDALKGETPYQNKLRQLNEQVAQANATYNAQQALLGNSSLYAPFDGTIVDVLKDPGETAGAGETIVKLADLNDVMFEIQVGQEDYGLLKEGQDVDVKLDSFVGFSFKGKVNTLPLYADSTTDNFVDKINVTPDSAHSIKLGMTGDAYIILQTTQTEVSALTADEIFFDIDQKPYVWVVRNKKLYKQYIETGLEGDVYTEVKTPISEQIVVPQKDAKIDDGYNAQILN